MCVFVCVFSREKISFIDCTYWLQPPSCELLLRVTMELYVGIIYPKGSQDLIFWKNSGTRHSRKNRSKSGEEKMGWKFMFGGIKIITFYVTQCKACLSAYSRPLNSALSLSLSLCNFLTNTLVCLSPWFLLVLERCLQN